MGDGKPPALLVQGLSKTYGDGFTAVAGLDLEIPDGAFFGLLSPNGAGKPAGAGSGAQHYRLLTGGPDEVWSRPESAPQVMAVGGGRAA
ncbi:hypothetical protein [Streptomyces sp. NPDC002078]